MQVILVVTLFLEKNGNYILIPLPSHLILNLDEVLVTISYAVKNYVKQF